MLVGRYLGQILDVEPVSARALIESGRGQDPNVPMATDTPEQSQEDAKPKKIKR
jgi:hypothetical protein